MCNKQEDVQSVRTKLNLTQKELGQKLNLSRQFICNIEKGIKKMPVNKMNELMKLYYSSFPHLKEDFIEIELLKNTGMNSFMNDCHSDEESQYAKFSSRLLNINADSDEEVQYGSLTVDTNAMEPTIKKGSRVIFEHRKNMPIIDNEIYIFYYKGELFVRRLSKNLTEYQVQSDNKNYNDIILQDNTIKNLNIAGKVIAVIFN